MKRRIGVLVGILVVCSSNDLQAQSGEFTKAESRTQGAWKVSSKQLERLDEFMNDAVDAESVVGASALVLQDGEEAYFRAWGYQDRESGVSVSRDTIFRIYSMTKPITSVAAMQLIEKNKMGLDDPVEKYIKSFGGLRVASSAKQDVTDPSSGKHAMTIRDLMRHTSGLTYGFFDVTNSIDQIYLQKNVVDSSKDLAEMVEVLSTIPLKHTPGTQFEYSVSTDVLARVIEVVSGQRFDHYLQKNIFDPLGMNDTSFYVPREKRDRLAVMYSDDGAGGLTIASPEASARFISESNLMFSGGGGLCSTIDDYAKFATMLMRQGLQSNGDRVLRSTSIQKMFTNQLVGIALPPRTLLNQEAPWCVEGFEFGLGFSIDQTEWGNDYTWNGIAGTQFWLNPESGTVILYMVQVFPLMGHDLAGDVRRLVYQSLIKN